MVQLPQRRRPLEDDVAGVAFDARPLAPRRPPTRTDSTVTPRVTALRSDNARGQRESITYGEGATSSTTTTYTYDPQRLWLTRLRTVRASDGAILQDLQYSRDHVGNVIEIDDDAQQTHWFDNAQVSPERTYSYDPLYRLSSATGREKVGLAQAGVLPFPVELLPHGGAANTVLRRTTQSDVDDAAGNLTETVHVAGGSVVWRRRAQVAAGNNQVLASSSGLTGEDIDDPSTWFSQYSHDRRGTMLVLPGEGAPNGMVATRDHRDHLESVALNSTDSAHYTYDGAGQRIAKVVDKGQFRHTTLTICGIEQTTKHNMAGSTPVLEEERGTLHIMDDQQRIALVETRTVTTTDEYVRENGTWFTVGVWPSDADARRGPSATRELGWIHEGTHLLGAPDEYRDAGLRVFGGRPPGHMGTIKAPIRSRSFRHLAAVVGADMNDAGYTGVLGPDWSGPWRPHWRGDDEDPQDYLRPVATVDEDRLK